MAWYDSVLDVGKTVLGTAGEAFGLNVGTEIAGNVMGNQGPSYSQMRRDNLKDAKRTQKYTRRNIELGNALDMANQKEMYDYRISQGMEAGMTPYEMYVGSSAGGAGGGTSGSGQTLGNAASQNAIANRQIQADQANQRRENRADRMTDLMKTQMQTNAQTKVAEIQSGATLGAAEISAEVQQARNVIAQGQLDLANKEFDQVTIPAAAANLGLTEQQTKKTINEVATSTPEFLRAMKILTMSAENLLATIMVNSQPVDVTDPKQLAKLSVEQRSRLLTSMVGISSHTYREATGIQAKGGEVFEKFLRASEAQKNSNLPPVPGTNLVPELGNGKPAYQGKPFETKPPRDFKPRHRFNYGVEG